MSPRLQMTPAVAGARLLGLGSFQPERVVTNDELAARVETSDEWIRSRVGIESRRFADKDTLLVDMAADAGARAIKDSGLEPSDIGTVIVATCTMIDNIPNAAAQVAHRIGIPRPGRVRPQHRVLGLRLRHRRRGGPRAGAGPSATSW